MGYLLKILLSLAVFMSFSAITEVQAQKANKWGGVDLPRHQEHVFTPMRVQKKPLIECDFTKCKDKWNFHVEDCQRKNHMFTTPYNILEIFWINVICPASEALFQGFPASQWFSLDSGAFSKAPKSSGISKSKSFEDLKDSKDHEESRATPKIDESDWKVFKKNGICEYFTLPSDFQETLPGSGSSSESSRSLESLSSLSESYDETETSSDSNDPDESSEPSESSTSSSEPQGSSSDSEVLYETPETLDFEPIPESAICNYPYQDIPFSEPAEYHGSSAAFETTFELLDEDETETSFDSYEPAWATSLFPEPSEAPTSSSEPQGSSSDSEVLYETPETLDFEPIPDSAFCYYPYNGP